MKVNIDGAIMLIACEDFLIGDPVKLDMDSFSRVKINEKTEYLILNSVKCGETAILVNEDTVINIEGE